MVPSGLRSVEAMSYECKAVIVTMSGLRSACGTNVRYVSLNLMPRLGMLNFPTFVCGVALLQTRRGFFRKPKDFLRESISAIAIERT